MSRINFTFCHFWHVSYPKSVFYFCFLIILKIQMINVCKNHSWFIILYDRYPKKLSFCVEWIWNVNYVSYKFWHFHFLYGTFLSFKWIFLFAHVACPMVPKFYPFVIVNLRQSFYQCHPCRCNFATLQLYNPIENRRSDFLNKFIYCLLQN